MNETFGEDGQGGTHAGGGDKENEASQPEMGDRLERSSIGWKVVLTAQNGGAEVAGELEKQGDGDGREGNGSLKEGVGNDWSGKPVQIF